MILLFADYEDDEWPENLGDAKPSRTLPPSISSSGESNTLKRYAVRKQGDVILYNMGAILAGIGAGYDIRISNTSGIHPVLQTGSLNRTTKQNAVINKATADDDASNNDYYSTGPAGAPHNTYHGHQNKYRPTVNFDVPIRFTEVAYDGSSRMATGGRARGETTSSDRRGSSGDRATDSEKDGLAEGSGRKDQSLISLSPSTDRAFFEFQKQISDTGCDEEMTRATGRSSRSTTVRNDLAAADAPPLTSRRWSHSFGGESSPDKGQFPDSRRESLRCQAGIPNAINPPPPHRSASQERQIGSADRPLTLDIIPRPRPHPGMLRKPLPVAPAVLPKASEPHLSKRIGDGSSQYSARKSSLGGTASVLPLPLTQSKSLIDVDVEGQHCDGTKPLPARSLVLHVPVAELEREFLS